MGTYIYFPIGMLFILAASGCFIFAIGNTQSTHSKNFMYAFAGFLVLALICVFTGVATSLSYPDASAAMEIDIEMTPEEQDRYERLKAYMEDSSREFDIMSRAFFDANLEE